MRTNNSSRENLWKIGASVGIKKMRWRERWEEGGMRRRFISILAERGGERQEREKGSGRRRDGGEEAEVRGGEKRDGYGKVRTSKRENKLKK